MKKNHSKKKIIDATRKWHATETKYTASDILTILERLQGSLPSVD